jgi:heme/copper-type cytochrome/quinol oxidase subunit 1
VLCENNSEILWVSTLFILFFSFLTGVLGAIKYIRNRAISFNLLILLNSLSIILSFRIHWVIKNFQNFLCPTSEKSEFGYTIYPPLSASAEQYEQLKYLKGFSLIPVLIGIISLALLVIIVINKKKGKESA